MVHSGAISSECTLDVWYLVQTFQYLHQSGDHCSSFKDTADETYWCMAGRFKYVCAFTTGTHSKGVNVCVYMYLRMCVADCYEVADRTGSGKW
jgi:hypothetical protein